MAYCKSCGAYIQERNAAIVIAVQHDSGKNDAAYPAGVHNRIRIRDNLFVNLPGGTVYAAAVKDMKIIGNRIVNCRRNPGFSAEAMHICNCEEMVSFDNLLFSTMALQTA